MSNIDRGGQEEGYLSAYPPRRWHLAVAAGLICAIYLGGVTDSWWPTPDSALYQGLGRNLFSGQGYRFNGIFSTAVTPGLPVVTGALWRVFGDGFWAPNLFEALCGLAALWVAFATLRRLAEPRLAFAAVVACGLSFKFYSYSHMILTDAPFALLFWGMLYAIVRGLRGSDRWLAAAVGLAVLAIVIRAPGLLIISPIAAGLVVETAGGARLGRRVLAGGSIFAAILITGAVFYLLARHMSERVPLYLRVNADSLKAGFRLHSVLEGFAQLSEVLGTIFTGQQSELAGYAFGTLVLAGLVSFWRQGKRMFGVFFILYILCGPVAVGWGAIRVRYFMPMYPVLFLAAFQGFCWTADTLARLASRPLAPPAYLRAASIIGSLILLLNMPRVVRNSVYFSYAAWQGRYLQVVEDGEFNDIVGTAQFLRNHVPPDAPVITEMDRNAIFHFLSGRRMIWWKRTERWKIEHAEAVFQDVLVRTEAPVAIVDATAGVRAYPRHLESLFARSPEMKFAYDGKHFKVYQRVGAQTGTAVARQR